MAVSVLGHHNQAVVDVYVNPETRQGQTGHHETTGGLADKVRICFLFFFSWETTLTAFLVDGRGFMYCAFLTLVMPKY